MKILIANMFRFLAGRPMLKPGKRTDLVCVSYKDADALLKSGWEIATPEEDDNPLVGVVWLEKRSIPSKECPW